MENALFEDFQHILLILQGKKYKLKQKEMF